MGSGAASRVGLLVNDLAPLNVDSQLLSLPPALGPPPSQSYPPYGDSSVPVVQEALPAAVLRAHAAAAAPAELVELSNGCVCCNLAGELRAALRRLAARVPPLEHVVVECTGVGEPAALAAAIEALTAEGAETETAAAAVGRQLFLHRMVTVVDVSTFSQLLGRAPSAALDGTRMAAAVAAEADGQAGPAAGVRSMGGGKVKSCATGGGSAAASGHAATEQQGGRRPLAALLAQQVEGADVVLLNKCDRLMGRVLAEQQQETGEEEEQGRRCDAAAGGEAGRGPGAGAAGTDTAVEAAARRELAAAVAVVRALNPGARVLPCVRCEVPPGELLGGTPGSGPAGPRRPAPEDGAAEGGSGSSPVAVADERHGRPVEGSPHVPDGTGARAEAAGDAEPAGADRAHEEDEYGIGSYEFRSRRPFHPARLWALLQALAMQEEEEVQQREAVQEDEAGGVTAGELRGGGTGGTLPPELPHPPPRLLRAKGLFWIASLPQAIWELSLAGSELEVAALTEAEEAEGEQAWEAWDDAPWLGLLEEY
ncbi:hypothetical protein GPECTOR_6g846 [Gonium pectorale]|uniref:CobW C-terminal domain-containing protein n=1 Tax=Gonium pectorale TaxID=33097 RepID=A0A150GW53_GONPE|nr:hypothetical protein GPECTOR_6g846 [Gonium pectorale]|eukprot:KXZ53928.1 hypothetical protein GPECTOR_6g846 [Gonium pectorale]